ncbi:hypothetical protein STAS_34044 [Striga asiatica]|uniref:Uncharacterized protein n=1 Tax=Striga asiatica TaxID=4170 RepID=A0A5A7RGI1_STRAF|nr:hypothetical protein STAS_34044 [Striga asiatica]
MFLVCNGILVILAKNLRLDSTSSGGIQITEMPLEDVEQVDYSPTSIGMLAEERPVSILIQKPPKMLSKEGENQENAGTLMENDNNSDVKNIEDLKEKQPTFLEVQETEVRACLGRESEREEEDEEEEEEELDTSSSEMDVVTSDVHVSTEELNMKFEEFIRKMKEELRIEARNTMIEAV